MLSLRPRRQGPNQNVCPPFRSCRACREMPKKLNIYSRAYPGRLERPQHQLLTATEANSEQLHEGSGGSKGSLPTDGWRAFLALDLIEGNHTPRYHSWSSGVQPLVDARRKRSLTFSGTRRRTPRCDAGGGYRRPTKAHDINRASILIPPLIPWPRWALESLALLLAEGPPLSEDAP